MPSRLLRKKPALIALSTEVAEKLEGIVSNSNHPEASPLYKQLVKSKEEDRLTQLYNDNVLLEAEVKALKAQILKGLSQPCKKQEKNQDSPSKHYRDYSQRITEENERLRDENALLERQVREFKAELAQYREVKRV